MKKVRASAVSAKWINNNQTSKSRAPPADAAAGHVLFLRGRRTRFRTTLACSHSLEESHAYAGPTVRPTLHAGVFSVANDGDFELAKRNHGKLDVNTLHSARKSELERSALDF